MSVIGSNEPEAPVEAISSGDCLSHLVGWQEGAALSAHYAIERIAKQINS